ncbi:MAG: DUF4176 domain-containing protein [Solobacterium sp.]|nr:DUF4176 domain-containing protein [Solobacterium sp.]
MITHEKTLPIGSVVLLKGASKRLMILGYMRMRAGSDQIYDYCGCTFPEGFTGPEDTAVFNHEDIERLIYVGFQNMEYIQFEERLQNVIEGKVPGALKNAS